MFEFVVVKEINVKQVGYLQTEQYERTLCSHCEGKGNAQSVSHRKKVEEGVEPDGTTQQR